MDSSSILAELRRIFTDTFHIDAPAPDVDLVDSGILDSFQLVELLFQLESKFAVQIDIESFDLDDLRTLERIGSKVVAKAAGGAAAQRVSVQAAS
jgi:D-alanine--poly(phosphoribitol) ligase subunit 2